MPGNAIRSLIVVIFILAALQGLAGDSSYTVREGETLFSVAKKARVPLDVLCAYNSIDNAAKLKSGTVIRFPGSYVVKKGDTLYGIARSLSIPLPKILQLNGMAESSRLKVGQKLFIPQEQAGAPAVRTADSQAVQTPPDPGTRPAPRRGPAAEASSVLPSVWPHPGRYEPLKGKISGLVFHGSQGDAVRSATGGEVKWVGPYWGWGKTVIIKSPDGDILLYAGNEQLLVNVGDRVSPGTDIARLGVSPQGGGAKLYFSIQGSNGQFVDPEKFFSGKNHA